MNAIGLEDQVPCSCLFLLKDNTCHFPTTACSWFQPGLKHGVMPRTFDENAFRKGFQTSKFGQEGEHLTLEAAGGTGAWWGEGGACHPPPAQWWPPTLGSQWSVGSRPTGCATEEASRRGLRIPPPFFLTTQVLISSPQFWTPKSSGNRKLFITHSAIKLTWCEAFHGLLNILMECEFLLQDIFCSGWGADPMSVGCSAHGHAHSIIYLKFENFAPGNQRVPRVWIRIVESVDFPSGVSTLPNFSLSRVSLGNVNRSHTFCWWYFCWQRVFEMVTRVPTAASSSSTDFLRYACRKTLCMGLQGSRVFLLVHGSLCFVIVRISLITSLMLNPFP